MIAYPQLLIALALVGSAAGAGYAVGDRLKQGEWDAAELAEKQAQTAAERVQAARVFAESERRYQEAQNAQDAQASDLRRARAARDSAMVERERLRDAIASSELAAVRASDADTASGTYALPSQTGQLLTACAGEYEGMASEAGELAGQLAGLQRWVRGVCTKPVIEGRGDLDGGRVDH